VVGRRGNWTRYCRNGRDAQPVAQEEHLAAPVDGSGIDALARWISVSLCTTTVYFEGKTCGLPEVV
jgi:hypothetical protein